MSAAPPAALPAPPQGGARRRAARRRRFDHIRALFVQTPASLIGYLIGWSLMVAMYWPLAPRGPMLAWSGVLAALLLVRLAHYLRFRRNPDADEATLHEWRRSWKALVLLQASMLGGGGVAVLGAGHALPPRRADAGDLQPGPGLGAAAGHAAAAVHRLHLRAAGAGDRAHRHRHHPALALAAGRHPGAAVHRAAGDGRGCSAARSTR